MNLGDPQQEALEAIVREEYKQGVKDIDFSEFAFNIAEKHQQSDDEANDGDEDDDLDESSDEFNKNKLNIPSAQQINENPELLKRVAKDDGINTQANLINDIHNLVSLLDQEEIEISAQLRKMASKQNLDVYQLRQLKTALSDLYDNRTTANYFTDWIIQLATMASTFFDGETAIPLINFKLNLTGYSTRVKAQTNSLNKENMKLARKVNKNIGKNTTTVFKWASILVLPALITIGANHGNKKLADYDKHNDLDSDQEEDDNDDESAYESSEEED